MSENGSFDKPTKVQIEGVPIVVGEATLTPRAQVEIRKEMGESSGRLSVKVVPIDVAVEQGDVTFQVATDAADDTPLRALAAISVAVMIACWLVVGFTRLRLRS